MVVLFKMIPNGSFIYDDIQCRGGSKGGGGGGGGRTRRAPLLKLEKIWFFGVKSWFFIRNTPTIFTPPFAIGKNVIFWRKIVIFHTKYPKNFEPPSARHIFFKCASPLTWNPGSAPAMVALFMTIPNDSFIHNNS
jgi:hypothetical protein